MVQGFFSGFYADISDLLRLTVWGGWVIVADFIAIISAAFFCDLVA